MYLLLVDKQFTVTLQFSCNLLMPTLLQWKILLVFVVSSLICSVQQQKFRSTTPLISGFNSSIITQYNQKVMFLSKHYI